MPKAVLISKTNSKGWFTYNVWVKRVQKKSDNFSRLLLKVNVAGELS